LTPGNLTTLAFEFSPTVEATAADTVTFDVGGLDRLFGLPQDVAAAIARRARECGVKANLALAANPDAAICAARGFSGVSMIPYGDEGKFLGSLPLPVLAPSPGLLETLERWGIRRFHQLAALPPLGIAERLGNEGMRLRELARGESERKLLPIPEPLQFEDEIELEYPVELLEPLAFLLARLVNGLATRLATRGLATDELRLRLKLENHALHQFTPHQCTLHQRTLRLPVPSLDTKAFLKLLQLDLESNPPAAPIVHLWMGVNPVKPQAAQTGLFVPVAPEPVKLELTLARIQAFVGEGRVGTPELLDTHRPDAFRVNTWGRAGQAISPALGKLTHAPSIPRLALRVFRPARAARVALASGQPSYVMADGVRGKVLDLAGPWRTSGDWWTPNPWHRDQWDVALSDGALYRIYCELRGWFVGGTYD
jgi:protein ImuB